MKILKPMVKLNYAGGHECPGCLKYNARESMVDLAWRRDKIGPYTETIEFCQACASKRHENETGERLMYRMREIKLGKDIAKNKAFCYET